MYAYQYVYRTHALVCLTVAMCPFSAVGNKTDIPLYTKVQN